MTVGESLTQSFQGQPLEPSETSTELLVETTSASPNGAASVPESGTGPVSADMSLEALLAEARDAHNNLLTVGTELTEAAKKRGKIGTDVTKDPLYKAAELRRAIASNALNARAIGHSVDY